MYWLDYSAAKLSGAVIKAAGYGGVIRYIDAPERLRTKHTNLNEYRDHLANGLTVRLVMQNTTTDADGGFAAGVANAQRAKAGADMLGYTGVIYFTNDRTTVPNQKSWQDYLNGAASVLGLARTGAYGFKNALDLAIGHAAAFWQAGRKSDLVRHANFWQDNNTQVTVGGVLCDRNLVIADYHPEDDMPLTEDDAKLVAKHIWYDWIWSGKNGDGSTWGMNASQVLAKLDTANAAEAVKVDALVAAMAKLSNDPDITLDAMKQIVTDAVDDAVAHRIQITGEVHIGPAKDEQ